MAGPNRKKNQPDPGASYKTEVAALKAEGPQRLYVLWGQEDYLREQFLAQVKNACLPDGGDDFSLHRFDGANLDLNKLADAVDAMPFLSDRSFIEVRGYDTNKAPEEDASKLTALISDLPDYCTLAFVMAPDFAPDGRLKLTKALKKHGKVLQFAQQESTALIGWVSRRFAAHEKRITRADAEYLIEITGGLMNRMIPEIEKIASYAKDEVVTRADIDAVTEKTPDAVVFEMTDLLAQGDRDGAMATLAELLAMKDAEPIAILAAIGGQMRRLYAAKICAQQRVGTQDAMALCDVRYEFLVQKLQRSARRFSLESLARSVELCAETDYAMKHTGEDDLLLLEDTLLKIMLEAAR